MMGQGEIAFFFKQKTNHFLNPSYKKKLKFEINWEKQTKITKDAI